MWLIGRKLCDSLVGDAVTHREESCDSQEEDDVAKCQDTLWLDGRRYYDSLAVNVAAQWKEGDVVVH